MRSSACVIPIPLGGSSTTGLSNTQPSSSCNPAGAVPGTDVTSVASGSEFAVGTPFRY